jgi:hypothetical protein
VNPQSNPNERFDQVESTLSQLSNSLRHLLTAQVLMNDRLSRGEKLIEQLAEQALQTNRRLDRAIEVLTDSQKHNDAKLYALSDIVRQWYERHGNGSGGQHPS